MAGSKFSHYEVLKKLGEGGMGVVYLAHDTDLDRKVALKFLPSEMVDSTEKIARFRQEARAISALNHPHIATIYGTEEAGEVKFLVFEYLPGGTLREDQLARNTRGEKTPLRLAVDWTIQIAEGLAHAHRHGIIHRDVKSSNVLFTEEGQVKIADFGLAKNAKEDTGITETGIAVGTPRCMSPEQAQGLPVDERTDIFSLGIVLFELIAGAAPFRGSHAMALMHELLYAPTPCLSRFRNDVPAALQAVVSKALEKAPESRYQTMIDFAAALRAQPCWQEGAAQRDQSSQATLTLAHASSSGPQRRWKVALGVVLAAGIPFVAGVTGVRHQAANWFFLRPLPAEKRIAVLEFTNIGADPKNQALTQGIMEVVSNSLTGMEGGAVMVVPATDVRKERVTSTKDAWRRLDATLAVTGSVDRNGEAVKVMINLVDTRSVTQLRSETLRTDLADPALSDRVVEKVALMLEPAIAPQDPKTLRDSEAHAPGAERYYIEGLGELQRDDRPESIDNAIASFKKAVALDGNYALAYAGLAEAQWRKYSVLKDSESMAAAQQSAARALQLSDKLAGVHITAGMVQAGSGHYEAAVRELEKALELEPHNADAYRELATTYSAMGRIDLAEATYKKALALRPDVWWSLKQVGLFYLNHGRFPEAEQYLSKVIPMTPASAKAHNNLGVVYVNMGRKEAAIGQFEKANSIEPVASTCSNLGYLYYMSGRFKDAAAQFEKATTLIDTDSQYWGNLADSYRWVPELAGKAHATYQHAIELIQKEIAINGVDALLHSRLATYWAALGVIDAGKAEGSRARKSAALEIAQAVHLSPTDGMVQFQAACVFEQAKQRDKALRAVKASLKAGPEHREEILKEPALESLRKDPRFLQILGTH